VFPQRLWVDGGNVHSVEAAETQTSEPDDIKIDPIPSSVAGYPSPLTPYPRRGLTSTVALERVMRTCAYT
jgi:hypothetical protein